MFGRYECRWAIPAVKGLALYAAPDRRPKPSSAHYSRKIGGAWDVASQIRCLFYHARRTGEFKYRGEWANVG